MEALLLIGSGFALFLNVLLGGAMFLVFVVYCVWRLTTKHKACSACESPNLIPGNSPIALKMLGY